MSIELKSVVEQLSNYSQQLRSNNINTNDAFYSFCTIIINNKIVNNIFLELEANIKLDINLYDKIEHLVILGTNDYRSFLVHFRKANLVVV